MEIAFEQKNIRDLCEKKDEADSLFGVDAANKLRARIADLRAFQHVAEIMIGKPEVINEHPVPTLKIDVCDRLRIVFTPNHAKLPFKPDGKVDWQRVTRIKIVSIGK